jgi:hypothetical protein
MANANTSGSVARRPAGATRLRQAENIVWPNDGGALKSILVFLHAQLRRSPTVDAYREVLRSIVWAIVAVAILPLLGVFVALLFSSAATAYLIGAPFAPVVGTALVAVVVVYLVLMRRRPRPPSAGKRFIIDPKK